MKWFGLGKHPLRKQTLAVFDIGSSTVGCSIVFVDNSGKIRIIFTKRIAFPFQMHFRRERLEQSMLFALEQVAQHAKQYLSKSGNSVRVDKVSCVLSSAWYISKTHVLSFKRQKLFTVSPSFIDKMVGRIEDHLERQETGTSTIIDKKILTISLNGYKTANPFGKRTKNIELSLYLAYMPASLKHTLQEKVEEQFSHVPVLFYSRALSMYATVRDHYAARGDFLLIDVGGELTDIALVLNDVLQESISIPMGIHTIARMIAKERNSTPQEGLSLMRMGMEKECALDSTSQEYKIVCAVGEAWHQTVLESLDKFHSTSVYPREIFLTIPQETGAALWLKQLLESEGQETSEIAFSVVILTPNQLHGFLEFGQGVVPDTPLALQSFHAAYS